ncbi:MAG: methyl-accepting chemotaxis protein [Planctomycetota bacterium]
MRIRTKLILITSLPLAVAVCYSVFLMRKEQQQLASAQALIPIHQSLHSVANLVDCLQLERGTGSGYLSSRSDQFRVAFEVRCEKSDMALKELDLQSIQASPEFSTRCDDVLRLIETLPKRRSLVTSHSVAPDEHEAEYCRLIEDLLSLTGLAIALVDDPEATRNTMALRELFYAQEYAGRERSAVAQAIAIGPLSIHSYERWHELQSRQAVKLENAIDYSTDEPTREALTRYLAMTDAKPIEEMRLQAGDWLQGGSATLGPKEWFDAATDRVSQLIAIRQNFAAELMGQSQASLKAAMWTMLFQLGLLVASTLGALAVCHYFGKRYFTDPLSLLSGMSRDLANGELDSKMQTMPEDEIGEVGKSIVHVRSVLQELHKQIHRHVEAARAGQWDSICDTSHFQGQFRGLAESINHLTDSLTEIDDEIGRVITKVADGDLSERMTGEYHGECARIRDSFNHALERITSMLLKVRSTNTKATEASSRVEEQSGVITKNATEQAAALVQIASSLEEMTSMTKQSADSALSAREVADSTKTASERGATQVTELVKAIERIKSVGDEQTEILKTIDEIAFQTNLLALNAAVEAARAGEAGKGFAVVADEVRNLALRSAEAATTTARMTEQALSETSTGVSLATGVSKLLEEICVWAQKSSQCVGEIASASNEQAQGIEQINTAVANLDSALQHSSETCQESNSDAALMKNMVSELNEMLGSFRFSQEDGSPQQVSADEYEIDRRHLVAASSATPAPAGSPGEALIPFEEDDLGDF